MRNFRKKTGRGQGYDWDRGKSNNALSAEEQGLVLAGAVSKELGCTTDFVQKNAPYEEWHHVSGWFNKKRYYRTEKVLLWWNGEGKPLWDKEKLNIEQQQAKTGTVCKIRFSDWLDRKTIQEMECKALIIKQGAKLSSFEILSDVWILFRTSKGKKPEPFMLSDKYKPGDQLTKKITFV